MLHNSLLLLKLVDLVPPVLRAEAEDIAVVLVFGHGRLINLETKIKLCAVIHDLS